jgi:two-component system sensor histidine kinase UhpB
MTTRRGTGPGPGGGAVDSETGRETAPAVVPTNADAARLLHELHVHQAELEAQNVELVRLRDELAVSLAAYTDLYEHAPVAYLTIDEQGRVAQLNRRAAALLGTSADDALGERLERHVRVKDRGAFLDHVARPEGEAAEEFELERTDDRGATVVRVECRPDAATGMRRIVMVDVTRRRQLEQAVLDAVTREQLRLGAELHDGLGQQLAGLRYRLASIARRQQGRGLPESDDVQACASDAAAAIGTCRALARGLSPLALYQGGLLEALRELVERMSDANGPKIRMSVSTRQDIALPASSRDHLFRIAQEALNNARQHSGATDIRVSLDVRSKDVILEIVDDGHGMDAATPDAGTGPGLGLGLMRHRAKLISAQLSVTSVPGRGTTVRCVCEQADRPLGDVVGGAGLPNGL